MQFSPAGEALLLRDGSIEQILGDELPSLSTNDKKILSSSGSSVRKIGEHTICSASTGDGNTLLHCYDAIPAEVRLTQLIRQVQHSAEHSHAHDANNQMVESGVEILSALGAVSLVPVKKRLQTFVNELQDIGIVTCAAAAHLNKNKVGKIFFSNRESEAAKSELAVLLKPAPEEPDQKYREKHALDSKLVAQKMGGKTLRISHSKSAGIALVLVDIVNDKADFIDNNSDLLSYLSPKKSVVWRALKSSSLYAAIIALIMSSIFLLQPAPVIVTGAAVARASQTVVVSLPFSAFLVSSNVRSGQNVRKGEQVAKLRSPELEDAANEQALSQNLERLNAQAALGKGNISEFQLAEKRADLSKERKIQIERRMELLTIKAPADGRVVNSLSSTITGSYIATGTDILELQPTSKFDISLEIARSDAVLIKKGQTGLVYFRGLNDDQFGFEITSLPARIVDQSNGQERLLVTASLNGAGQERLLVGLSGYAKIDTGLAPRIWGLVRPVIEYVRFSIWKNTGFSI